MIEGVNNWQENSIIVQTMNDDCEKCEPFTKLESQTGQQVSKCRDKWDPKAYGIHVNVERVHMEDMTFGEGGECLCHGMEAEGEYPNLVLSKRRRAERCFKRAPRS
jgi:hypothetical protein